MKAVAINTMIRLLCLACVVLAAPLQQFSHPKGQPGLIDPASFKQSYLSQDQTLTCTIVQEEIPSVMDGAARFACW